MRALVLKDGRLEASWNRETGENPINGIAEVPRATRSPPWPSREG